MEMYGTTANLPRHGRPPKLKVQARRALIREAAKRPVVILQSSTGQLLVMHSTNLAVMEEWQEESHC